MNEQTIDHRTIYYKIYYDITAINSLDFQANLDRKLDSLIIFSGFLG